MYVFKDTTFTILGICSYISPTFRYDAFTKAYKCTTEKEFFPNDCFDNRYKLSDDELPSLKLFYSKMKNKNIGVEEYIICVNAWKDNNMNFFGLVA